MRALVALLFFPLLGLAQSEMPRPLHVDAAPNAGGHSSNKTTALWDVKFNYDLSSTAGQGNAGVVWTGTEFWVSRWATDTLWRFNGSGTLIGSFTIPGVTGVRGMTYHRQDGHVYAALNTTTIHKINTTTRTSVGTITAPQTVRWITYDSTAASGAGGFWIGNFGSNINQISMTGTTLATISSATHGLTGLYGGAIDHWSTGGPFLWVFDQTGGAVVKQLDLPTGVPTGVTHDVATDAGSGVSSILAGGLYICKNGFGTTPTMMGVCQGTPNRLFGYELTDPSNMDLANSELSIPGYVAIGATSVTGTVTNLGLTTVTSFDLSYSINGGAAVTTTISSVSITTGGTYNYTHPTAMNFASAGSNAVKVWISNVNGGSLDVNKTNDTLNATVVVLSSVPTKHVILEDHTGAWCQYCPDGTVILEQVLTANPNVIGVAVHNSDMMDSASTQWSGYRLQSTYISGYPGGIIDHFRFNDESAVEINRGTWASHIAERLAMPSPASVNISSASYNSSTRTISATVDATFYGDMSGNFRVNLFVTADSLIGTGTGWNQANYYNSVSGHPYYGAGNPIVGFEHNHVLLSMLGGPWGTPGVIPGTVTSGSTYSQSYSLTLPSSMAFWGSSGQTALIDPSRIHLIAVVQKFNSGDINDREILNSFEIPLNLATGISNSLGNGSVTVFPNPVNDNASIRIELTSNSNVLVEVYDLLGKRVAVLNDGMMNAGASTINWNGNSVVPGIYMVKVTANGASSTTKVVINH